MKWFLAIILCPMLACAWQSGMRSPAMMGRFQAAASGCPGIVLTGIGQTNTTAGASTYTLATSNAPVANSLMLV